MVGKLETMARSRRLRLAAAVSMAAVGLRAFMPYMANEVGGEAWVNAPLTRISSPIAGTVTTELPAPGAHLTHPRTAVLVKARALDSSGLGALLDQQAAMQAGLNLAEQQLAEIAAADQRLAVRAGRFESAAVARLVATTDAARADAEACTAEAREARQQLARIETLAAKGFATNATQDRARADASASQARCTALAARLEVSLSETRAARAKAIGCVACLSKTRDMDALADALALLFQGGSLFDLAEPLGKDLLSQRRQHLLQLAAQGRSNKEIARLMGITERTVKDHWGHIFAQLAVSNRAEAVSRAHQTGLIS